MEGAKINNAEQVVVTFLTCRFRLQGCEAGLACSCSLNLKKVWTNREPCRYFFEYTICRYSDLIIKPVVYKLQVKLVGFHC